MRVAIDLYLTLRRTYDGDCTHTSNTCNLVAYAIVQNLVQTRHTLLRCCRDKENRHIVRAKLEDHRGVGIVREGTLYKLQLIPHIIGSHIYIYSILKCKGNHRGVLL